VREGTRKLDDYDVLERELTILSRSHRHSRILFAVANSVTTVATLVSSGAAAYFAMTASPNYSAILALTATVLVGADKTFQFGDKSKFHRQAHGRLEVLRAEVASRLLDLDEAWELFAKTQQSIYAESIVSAPDYQPPKSDRPHQSGDKQRLR
jgi:hypothetical protein